MDKTTLGKHYIIDFEECDPQSLQDCDAIKLAFHIAAEKAKCNIVNECFHQFEPYGVSGVTIISESHFTIHTWQEHNYAAVDLFYCGDHVEIQNAIDYLTNFFSSKKVRINELHRGIST